MKFKNRVRKAVSEESRDEGLFVRGIDGTAVVNSVKKSMWTTGEDLDEKRVYKYSLTVTVPGRSPYDVEHTETVGAEQGATVKVKVDPDDPKNLVFDGASIKAEATNKWAAQTEAAARLQQMEQGLTVPTAAANDAASEPIAGLSLDRYAELCAARVKAGIATEEGQQVWLATQGVEPSDWKTASDGWAQRMAAQPAVAARFAAVYQRASS
jgi:hypothetical protein